MMSISHIANEAVKARLAALYVRGFKAAVRGRGFKAAVRGDKAPEEQAMVYNKVYSAGFSAGRAALARAYADADVAR